MRFAAFRRRLLLLISAPALVDWMKTVHVRRPGMVVVGGPEMPGWEVAYLKTC